ncbi:MAG: DUF4160 domain-containing protein [Terracidiphilus sp.]
MSKRDFSGRHYNGCHHANCFSGARIQVLLYSIEGSPREPVHVHVEKDDLEAKFWLNPEVKVAYIQWWLRSAHHARPSLDGHGELRSNRKGME